MKAAQNFEHICRINGIAGKLKYQNGKLLINDKELNVLETKIYYKDARQVQIKSDAGTYDIVQVDGTELFRLIGLVLRQNFIAEQPQPQDNAAQ